MSSVYTLEMAASQPKPKGVTIPNVIKSGKGFSFDGGKLVPIFEDGNEREYSQKVDFMWDPKLGLIANNTALGCPFSGKGEIADLGKRTLPEITVIPKGTYVPHLKPEQMKVGHVYCIRRADGKGWGLIAIDEYDVSKETLVFRWTTLQIDRK
jgi:hypothetical protein